MLAAAILKKADASTCNELRKALQGYGLSIYGNKETLMRRLKSHHKIIKKSKSNKKMTKKSVDKILPENEDGTKNCTVIITNDEKNLADHYSKDQGASKTKNDIGSPTSGTEISSKNQSPSKYEEKVEQDTGMILFFFITDHRSTLFPNLKVSNFNSSSIIQDQSGMNPANHREGVKFRSFVIKI